MTEQQAISKSKKHQHLANKMYRHKKEPSKTIIIESVQAGTLMDSNEYDALCVVNGIAGLTVEDLLSEYEAA